MTMPAWRHCSMFFGSGRREAVTPSSEWPGHQWRSSNTFIISTMSMALFTDELLFAFTVPLLPTILGHRIGLPANLIQRYTSVFLAEGALVSIVSSPFIGSIADKTSSKKLMLLALLVLTLVSIVCLSQTTTLLWLFVGRFVQCIVSNALWIVGMATMADNIGSEHMGKIAGLSSTLTAAGTCAGPAIAGFLFALGGYWTAWTGAFVFVFVDIIMRLLMIEKPRALQEDQSQEQDPLLDDSSFHSSGISYQPSHGKEMQGWHFYVCIFRQPRFSAGVLCYFVFSLFIGSFESTLAMHVKVVFGWDALPVGLLLALIQGPGIIFALPVGWLKDRVGSRVPTMIGFVSAVPFLLFLGIPGDENFPWANVEMRGKIIYSVCVAVIGCLTCLLNGVGTMEATETVDKLESQHPGIFGLHGGYCRAISVTNMALMTGLLTGPVISEFMIEKLGYFELQCVIAVVYFVTGLILTPYLSSASSGKVDQQTDEQEPSDVFHEDSE